jgi:uncharacterized protein with von Willebrand factor type A (vWA) domain
LRAQDRAQIIVHMNNTSSPAQATREISDVVGDLTFGAETIELDVPAVAAALSRRLYAAGVQVTPQRAVSLVQALTLVGPTTRRSLYYSARAVLVCAPAQLPAFDHVFASVFGSSTSELTIAT